MKVYNLSLEEQAASGYTKKVVITHEDLTTSTANTAQTIEMFSVPAGTVVSSAAYRLIDGFEDASDNALNATTLIVGDGGNDDRYIPSKELNENGTEIDEWATSAATNTLPFSYLSADTVDAIFGSMTDKSLSDIDTGEVHIYLGVYSLPSA
jgi:hypothetical protein